MRYLVNFLMIGSFVIAGCGGSTRQISDTPKTSSTVSAQRITHAEYTIEQLMESISYRGLSFSPDNSKLLTSSDQSGIFNAYAVPVNGDTPIALTQSTTESILALSYFPKDERFLYGADQGGNELYHIYIHELDGTVRDLTPGARLVATFNGWVADRTSFFVTTNERDPRYFDLYEFDTGDYTRTLLYENNDGYQIGSVSADRRFVALMKFVDNANTDIYIHDRKNNKTTLLTTAEGDIDNRPATFSPTGHTLYYMSDQDHEFQYLLRHNLDNGKSETVLKLDWDIRAARFSEDGSKLIVTSNQNARSVVDIYTPVTMERINGSNMPAASITSATLSADGETLALIATHGQIPGDIYVRSSRQPPRRLLSSLNKQVKPEHLVAGEVVRFKSYDGLDVPGILYRPHQATGTAKLPALVWVHGGPGGESRIGYQPFIQSLVNAGYVVYAVNNRGSSGSGKTFFHLDDHNHGKGDLGDVIASKQMLIDTGYVDPDRIGIIGASYGGYMVLAALAFEPESFAVGVNIFGVANWLRTIANMPPWWEAQRNAMETEIGNPRTEEEYLTRISPYFHASNIVRPLIVLQGANDPRVLQIESDEIVEKVRANGVPVEYVLFPDEGHGFRKKANQITANKAISAFLDKYLKNNVLLTQAQ
ncbi:MAG: S9 family peptidase [Gammaproteobacteria bacterium]|nr:S9 family peptidase [Gammaproteobacteria bacterium]